MAYTPPAALLTNRLERVHDALQVVNRDPDAIGAPQLVPTQRS